MRELKADITPRFRQRHRTSRTVAEDIYTLPEDMEAEDIDGAEGYKFSRSLTIPRNLRQCSQTVDTMGIRTKHCLILNVQMHNPDSHVSEVTLVYSRGLDRNTKG